MTETDTTLPPAAPSDAAEAEPVDLGRRHAGVAAIERALLTMPLSPGVYRMLDAKGDALYVGKARSLKKRVVSYTQVGRLPERLRRMVARRSRWRSSPPTPRPRRCCSRPT